MTESQDASTTLELRDEDLPALFRAADEASKRNQSTYLWLVKIDLVLLVLGALLSSVVFADETLTTYAVKAGASCLALSLVLTLVLGLKRYDRFWYRGRAIAESVKTLAWRYATTSAPFHAEPGESLGEDDFRDLFLDRIKEIREDARGLVLRHDPEGSQQITAAMERLRRAPASERIRAYVEGRIRNQERWYAGKARTSQRAENIFFAALITAQGLAVASSFSFLSADMAWNPAGIFASVATAFAAWLQVKQHQELAEAYSSTAFALADLAERAKALDTEERLREFVADAESAISREHTSWLARRDH